MTILERMCVRQQTELKENYRNYKKKKN